MKKLTYLLTGLLLAVGIIGVVNASMNIVQKSDGTAVWQSSGASEFTVGAVYLTVVVSPITAERTWYVVSPVTGVRISYVQSVIDDPIGTADTLMDFWVLRNGATEGSFSSSTWDGINSEVTNGTIKMTIATSGSARGVVDTFTPTDTTAAHVGKNDAILVHTNGAGTLGAIATFTITLVPR